MRAGTITLAFAVGASIPALSEPAQAQAPPISYDIPAGTLKSALDAYGRQSGRPVIYRVDQVRGVRSRGYRGPAGADKALDELLAGTGFIAHEGAAGAVAIVRAAGNQPRAASRVIVSDIEIVLTAHARDEIAGRGRSHTAGLVRDPTGAA